MVFGQPVVSAKRLTAVIALEWETFLFLPAEMTLHNYKEVEPRRVFTYLIKLRKHSKKHSQIGLSSVAIFRSLPNMAKGTLFGWSGELEASKSWFSQAAHLFFDLGSVTSSRVERALFEYSTLMDAFTIVQQARRLKLDLKYEESLSEFTKAAEILRSTVHFGFLSGYESGCATLETAVELKESDEAFQAFKNAITLFEQSKLDSRVSR